MFRHVSIRNTLTSNLNKSKIRCNLFNIPKFSFRIDHTSRIENFSERKQKGSIYYLPKGPLVFSNGRLSLLDTSNSNYVLFLNKQNKLPSILITTSIFTLACGLFYGSNPVSVVSALVLASSLFMKKNLSKNLSRVVVNFNLLEDGKTIEIVTIGKKFQADIKLLAKPSKVQLASLKTFNPDIAKAAIPFIVEKGEHKGYYYVVPDGNYENNKEILTAVMNNSYIKIDPGNIVGSKDRIVEK